MGWGSSRDQASVWVVNATILLCDAAVVSEAKLFVLGGGWNLVGPGPTPMAIALKIDVDYAAAADEHHWELFLEELDGSPVILDTPEGPRPVEVRGDFRVGSPEGIPVGADVSVNIAINLGPLPLEPGKRFVWKLAINGASEEHWSASFSTRAMPDLRVVEA